LIPPQIRASLKDENINNPGMSNDALSVPSNDAGQQGAAGGNL